MNTQRIDLIQAQDSILEAIKEMDEIMVERFFRNVLRKSTKSSIMSLGVYLVEERLE